jgi:hypothetical protein
MTVVEVVLCRAKANVSEAEMREAARLAEPEMDSLPGLISRELLVDSEGQWVDIVHWESMEHAQNALQLVGDKPAIQHLFSLIDEDQTRMMHLHPVTLK